MSLMFSYEKLYESNSSWICCKVAKKQSIVAPILLILGMIPLYVKLAKKNFLSFFFQWLHHNIPPPIKFFFQNFSLLSFVLSVALWLPLPATTHFHYLYLLLNSQPPLSMFWSLPPVSEKGLSWPSCQT